MQLQENLIQFSERTISRFALNELFSFFRLMMFFEAIG